MAETFARSGDQVVIIGRHEDTLRGIAEAVGLNCTWQPADGGHEITRMRLHVRAEVPGIEDIKFQEATLEAD